MRFFILNIAYEPFLESLYETHEGLADASYREQRRAQDESLFGTADFVSANLNALGHSATDVCLNNVPMQIAWATERMPHLVRGVAKRALRRRPPLSRILVSQIAAARPDVIVNQDLRAISAGVLRRAAPGALLVGQHGATTFDDLEPLRAYDLVLTQVRPLVEQLRERGVPAEELQLGFEPRVLAALDPDGGAEEAADVVFVGSLFPGVHDGRIQLLEAVCERFPQTAVWSADIAHLPAGSAIRRCYRGQAWGKQMYELFRSARVVLNHHGDFFAYAENCRLYEATGVGGFLLTEAHPNLHELFEPGREVGTYVDQADCLDAIERYLGDESGRRAIAAAGQARTLREHTYRRRMAELVAIVEPRLHG